MICLIRDEWDVAVIKAGKFIFNKIQRANFKMEEPEV